MPRPQATLQLQDGGTLSFDIDEKLGRQLGGCLFQDVTLEDKVVWDPREGTILSFEPARMVPEGTADLGEEQRHCDSPVVPGELASADDRGFHSSSIEIRPVIDTSTKRVVIAGIGWFCRGEQ